MNIQEYLNRISTLLARFNDEVSNQNKNGEYGINIHSENVLIHILNVVWDCNLENINYSIRKTAPGIDLLDKEAGIAVQVTSNDSIDKIVETLDKVHNNYYGCNINKLYIFVLKNEMIRHYSSVKIKNAIGDFAFTIDDNMIDFSTLYKHICAKNDMNCIIKIRDLLEEQFSDHVFNPNQKWQEFYEICKEIIVGNLIDERFTKYTFLEMSVLCTDAAHFCGHDISNYIRELLEKTFEMNQYKRIKHPTMQMMIEREEIRRYFSKQLNVGLINMFRENGLNTE